MNTCRDCKEAKPIAEFSLIKATGRLMGVCKRCSSLRFSAWAKNNKERLRLKRLRKMAGLSELENARMRQKRRAYYQNNKQRFSEQKRNKYLQAPEATKARTKQWKKDNRGAVNAQCAERHTRKLMACPAWMDEDQKWMIEEIYDLAIRRTAVTGVKHHVDHIVPLQHKLVCGLHVPWNLQVITASENCSKRNSFTLS